MTRFGTRNGHAAITGAPTNPIVVTTSADPVEARLVTSLNRPAANITGVTTLSAELCPKWLEVLHELLRTAGVVALLVKNSDNSTTRRRAERIHHLQRRSGAG
jgi:putative tryptophan/tyrosine transport system substrate-binding protein